MGGVLPRWAREYGSGNGGDEEERASAGWQVRVEEMTEREAVERRLQEHRAADEVRMEARGYMAEKEGGEEEACGREVGGEAGEESDDEGGAEVVLVRGIEEGGEARGDESRPLPVWHLGRKVGKVTSRARAAQAVEGAVRDAQAAQGTGGKERVQGVGMAVDEEATLVLRKGRGRPKRSAKSELAKREAVQRRCMEATGASAVAWDGEV